MAVRTLHQQKPNTIYFITVTCYRWLPLIDKTNSYDLFYKWFDYLNSSSIRITGYVIMPNHAHLLLYFPEMKKTLNTIVGNGKRIIAYEIIRRLKESNDLALLSLLHVGVRKRERQKGQLHKVFEDSFDAKECYSKDFVFQKLDYMHHNPITGKWNLAKDSLSYAHSSAAFYEGGSAAYKHLVRIEEFL